MPDPTRAKPLLRESRNVATPFDMTPREVVRALRLVTSREFRSTNYFPVSVIAQMTGLSRQTIYEARLGNGLTPRVVQLLAPLLNDILVGNLAVERGGWQTVVRKAGMLERPFFNKRPVGRRHRLVREVRVPASGA